MTLNYLCRRSGGFVDENEGLETAALRELEEETGVTSCKMVQTGSYGKLTHVTSICNVARITPWRVRHQNPF